MSTPKSDSITVNRITYRLPAEPVVIVCLAGTSAESLMLSGLRGHTPHLTSLAGSGHFGTARGALPSSDTVNEVSLITGVPPSVHGICGESYLKTSHREEVSLLSARQMRASSLLSAAQTAGRRVAILTATNRSLPLLTHGLDADQDDGAAGRLISAETVSALSAEEYGAKGLPRTGRDLPPPGDGMQAALWLLEMGVALMKAELTDFLLLAPGDPLLGRQDLNQAAGTVFHTEVDKAVGEFLKLGALVGLTSTRGSNVKLTPQGEPQILHLESMLTQQFGVGFRVHLPESDPTRAGHTAPSSCATVYLPSLQPLDPIVQWLLEQPAVTEVHDRRTAVRKLQLPEDRIGELVVLTTANACIGRDPERHPEQTLRDAPYRQGGRFEERVPLVLSKPLNSDYLKRAASEARQHTLIDYLLNGTRQP